MIRSVLQSVGKLISVSGVNGYFAYFNFSQIPVYSWMDDVRGALGIIATFVAIVYGFYQIRLIRRKLKKDDR